MSEISGFFYCAKCDKNTSFCGGSGGAKNDHNTRGNNIEWKFKDNKWSIKNKYMDGEGNLRLLLILMVKINFVGVIIALMKNLHLQILLEIILLL